jgi:hypothetical protein
MSGTHRSPDRRLSRRAKIAVAAGTVAVVGGLALGYFAVFPKQAPAFVRSAMQTVGFDLAEGDDPTAPMPTCPLTGTTARGGVPERPVLAVKIENHPSARPQAGLQSADIVYEEPVEGGITRFISIYQCSENRRIGPVRSARTTDPDVLEQFENPILVYSGAAPNVDNAVAAAPLVALTESDGGDAFTRDPARAAPHNLYASTPSLYRAARAPGSAPAPIFRYADDIQGRSRRAATIHLAFSSSYSDVYWSWNRKAGEWVRFHGTTPHVDEAGNQISATNVVVQVVDMGFGTRGGISPLLNLTGSGKVLVFRDGRVIVGRWERNRLDDVTRLVTKDGNEIALAPGRTWVELFPSSAPLEYGASQA